MGELARLKAVTERVPCSNHRIFPNLPLQTPSQSRYARQLPQRGSQGRLRRRICADLPSGPGGRSPPLGSPYGRAKGGCAAGCARSYPLRRRICADLPSGPGGRSPPLWTQKRDSVTLSRFFLYGSCPLGDQQAGNHPYQLIQQHMGGSQQLCGAQDGQGGHDDHA